MTVQNPASKIRKHTSRLTSIKQQLTERGDYDILSGTFRESHTERSHYDAVSVVFYFKLSSLY